MRVLLLGGSGKLGYAMQQRRIDGAVVMVPSSQELDVLNFEALKAVIEQFAPTHVINATIFGGIDACEQAPTQAFVMHALVPKQLAELSALYDFTLVHISSDAVFNNNPDHFFVESDIPSALNVYGMTKYGGDCFVQAYAKKHYIARLSLQFGPSLKANQFVEKMLAKLYNGEKRLWVSDDVYCMPTLSFDTADAIWSIITQRKYGLYHVVGAQEASLYDLMHDIVKALDMDAEVIPVKHTHFSSQGLKNLCSRMKSEKIPLLRGYNDALSAYVSILKEYGNE